MTLIVFLSFIYNSDFIYFDFVMPFVVQNTSEFGQSKVIQCLCSKIIANSSANANNEWKCIYIVYPFVKNGGENLRIEKRMGTRVGYD